MSFGWNAGYAINPARDFGPRLFTALAGWGGEVFSAGDGWWWVPIVAPCLGALSSVASSTTSSSRATTRSDRAGRAPGAREVRARDPQGRAAER